MIPAENLLDSTLPLLLIYLSTRSFFHFLFFPDCRRGQSLVVHAINEGRQAARQIDLDPMGHTSLAGPGGVVHTPGSKVYHHAEHANKIYKPLLEAMA